MKQKLLLTTLLILACFLFKTSPLKADHLMGSDIQWTCVGNDTFIITVTVYRDCNGISMPGQSFDLNPVDKGCKATTATISTTQSKGKDITPVCKKSCDRCGKVVNTQYGDPSCKFPYGVELYTFTAKVIFGKGSTKSFGAKGCCNINISWTQCCRSGTLTDGGNWQNFYVDATMNRCVRPCDNSPSFTNPPIAIICKGACFSYNPGVSDPDVDAQGRADSMVYSITKPKQDKTTYVTYTGKFSYAKPLSFDSFPNVNAVWNPPSCAGFHLDSSTGDLQFMPTKVEQTVIAIQVQEWGKDSSGNPILKGTTRRDMQLIVMSCPNNHPPTLSGINGTSSNDADFCVGQYTCFTINSDDPDKGDTVSVNWNNALASLGGTFVVEKKKQHPQSQFCWKPKASDVRSYPYQFIVTAKDDACPLSGQTQRSFRIRVHPSPDGVITGVDSGCGNWIFTVTPVAGTFNQSTGGTIRWGGDDKIGGSGLVVRHHYQKSGDSILVQVTLSQPFTSAIGTKTCPVVLSKKFYIPPYVLIQLPRDTIVCKADSPTIFIPSTSSGGAKPYVYKWNVGGNTTSSMTTPKIYKDTFFYLTIWDQNGAGCKNTDTIHIKALVPQKPGLGPDQRYCGGAVVTLSDTAIHDSMGYDWYNALLPGTRLSDSTTAMVKDSGAYVLRVNDPRITTCFNYDTVNVFFNQPVVVVPQTIKGCANTPVTIDAGGGKGDTTALWQWRDLYTPTKILYTGRKITLIPRVDMHFFVTTLQTYNGLTCGDSDTINVNLYPLPPVRTGKVPDQCFNNPPIDLSAYTTTPGGTWYMPAFTNAVSAGHLYPDSVTQLGLPQALIYVIKSSTTGCKDSTKQAIKIDTIPLIRLMPDTFQCIDAPRPFNLDSTVITPVGGSWSGPAVTNGKFYQNNPQAGGDGVKKFTYTYVNKASSSGCSNSADLNITVYRVLNPNAGPDKKSCQFFGSDIELNGTLANFDPQWYLDPAGSTPSGALELTPAGQYIFHPDLAGAGDHTLIYEVSHPGHRCPKTDTMVIHVNPNPTITLGANPPLCLGGGPVKLQASPQGVNFTMLYSTDPNALANSPYYDPTVAGKGTDSVHATYFDKNGCFTSSNFEIEVDDTPYIQIVRNGIVPCAGQNIELHANFGGGVQQIQWTSSDPATTQKNFIYDPNDAHHATYLPGPATDFIIYAKSIGGIVPASVCALPHDSIPMTINPNPVVNFTATSFKGCSPLEVDFKNLTTISSGGFSNYQWDYGDNTADSGSDKNNPKHVYISDVTKKFNVRLTVTSTSGCVGTKDTIDYIQVYATPRPWFDAVPFYTTISLPDITFNDSTTINDPAITRGQLIHRWDFGDGSTSDTRAGSFSHTYGDTGFYTVKLWVQNPEFNCEAETIRVNYIDIRPELIVFIPNVFTPNHLYNDRTIVNEKFSPVVANYSSYRLEVFSRWGELLYSTTDITAGWDGNYLGKQCQEGVYIYRIEAVSMEGKKYKYSGTITLLR